MVKKNKEPEKTLEENLKDPVWTSYNTLLKLEEIKKINLAMYEVQKAQLEMFNMIVQMFQENSQIEEPESLPKEKKEEREGTLATKDR